MHYIPLEPALNLTTYLDTCPGERGGQILLSHIALGDTLRPTRQCKRLRTGRVGTCSESVCDGCDVGHRWRLAVGPFIVFAFGETSEGASMIELVTSGVCTRHHHLPTKYHLRVFCNIRLVVVTFIVMCGLRTGRKLAILRVSGPGWRRQRCSLTHQAVAGTARSLAPPCAFPQITSIDFHAYEQP